MQTVAEQGAISVNTENIFPIIKKFLYADHEIFIRELVANAMDATQKLKKLSSMGEFTGEVGELAVKVSVNPEEKTITVEDNGIGMTADEIKKYINQVAFSGATEFIEKYKDKQDTKEIIGHFGLGFYSAFMVSEKVEIITKSFKDGAEPALWTCDGSTSYSIEPTEKAERGTKIILHVTEESKEFLEKSRLQGILDKYCKFLPITIQFEGETINETKPIWTISPNELKDEDYLEFYSKLYPMSEPPLFWIHLNVDYPFELTGILYFPKVKTNIDIHREKIQLYSRQVFITDEVKDVVPEYLMLLHGVIDSPDIPLNVSRSFLQADTNVKKINTYITKKVAEKLGDLFKENRTGFEEKWESLGLFVKYGYLSDDKFREKAKNFTLLQNVENKYFTIDEYRERIQAIQTDKNDSVVFLYTSDEGKQQIFIQSAQKKGYDVLKLEDKFIDSHFVSALEQKEEKIQLKRVDADTVDNLINNDIKVESVLSEDESKNLKEIFEKILDNKSLMLSVQSLPTDEMPAVITVPEFVRRMQEMSRGGGMFGNFPQMLNLAINANHTLTQKILKGDENTQNHLVKHIYDLALLSQDMLKGKALAEFIQRSVEISNK
jgi:molecular chaperone HtpG